MVMTFSFSSDGGHVGNTRSDWCYCPETLQFSGGFGHDCTFKSSIKLESLTQSFSVLEKSAGDISHNSHAAGEIAQCPNNPTSVNHDRNTVEQSDMNYEPQKTNFRRPRLHLSGTSTP